MKKLVMLIVMLCLAGAKFAGAQDMPSLPMNDEKKVTYTEVVQLPNTTKDKLYERGLKAINNMYKEATKKIALNDKENKLIKMNCTTQVVLKDPKSKNMIQVGLIKYKLEIGFKDGKYKYTFYDFHSDQGGFKMPIEKLMEEGKKEDRVAEKMAFLDEDIKKLIEKLKEDMKADKVIVKEDW